MGGLYLRTGTPGLKPPALPALLHGSWARRTSRADRSQERRAAWAGGRGDQSENAAA